MFDDVTNGMCVDSPIGERIRSWRKNRKVNNMKMAELMMNNQTVFLLIIARDKIFYFLLIFKWYSKLILNKSTVVNLTFLIQILIFSLKKNRKMIIGFYDQILALTIIFCDNIQKLIDETI